MPRNPVLSSTGNQLQGRKLKQAPVPTNDSAAPLLAASTLSEGTIKRLISCYAKDIPPGQVGALCGVSHVTAYRLYGLIRQRLLAAGIYRPKEAFIDMQNEVEEAGGSYFPWEAFETFLRTRLGAHRGIRPGNRDLYIAEAIFHYERRMTPGQLAALILVTIKASGPLNRTPPVIDRAPILREMQRLHMLKIRKEMRALLAASLAPAELTVAVDRLERLGERVFDEAENIKRKAARTPKRKRAAPKKP